MQHREVTLDDKYDLVEGKAYMTGIQALVRLPLDRKRLDLKNGKAWESLGKGPGLQGLALVAHNNKLYRLGGFAAKNKEGDRALEIAQADAQAIEREGLNTATGIKRLAEAYSEGGTGLVKEALSRKLVGAKINGRPYSLSERIDHIEIDQKRRAAATGN